MAAAEQFVTQNKTRLLDELKTFLRIPSISTLPETKMTSPKRRLSLRR